MEIQKCSKGISNSFNLIHHYFVRIPELNIEIHPGSYTKGIILPLNDTKKYSIKSKVYQCKNCVNLMLSYMHLTGHTWYYPMINCETLTNGICNMSPLSFQFMTAITSFSILLCPTINFKLRTFLVFIIALIHYIYQNNSWLNISERYCEHLGKLFKKS